MSPTPPETGAPYPDEPLYDPQAGLDQGDAADAGEVATGDRREEVHFEADPNQLVVARHLARPRGPLFAQGNSPGDMAVEFDAPPVEDVAVAPEGPSVWDARPLPDDRR
jgi:hypothetical protein